MSLQSPPKEDSPSRTVRRFLVLLLLALAAGVVIYTTLTSQRIDQTENIRASGLELASTVEVGGLTIHLIEDAEEGTPVVFLHGVDVTGGMTLAGLSAALDDSLRGIRVDLPGFGYSDRLPSVGPGHTAAGMADTVAAVLEERFTVPVIVVGVGFGGEVGADLALTHPDLVSGLVLVDTDFWSSPSLEITLERLPFVGRAATYTWETGGRLAVSNWSPHCEAGGWCPDEAQLAERSVIVAIEDTTDSLHAFRRTPEAALGPANLSDIPAPMAFVWSTRGEVPEESLDRINEETGGVTVFESSSFQAHLEDHDSVLSAIEAVAG
jgi:pimeloyl-ACP methyl ester carboxylesterase